MIAEEFNAHAWSSQQRAVFARKKRAADLEEEGYQVFLVTKRALDTDYNGYVLIAILPDDPAERINPVNPPRYFDGWEIVGKYLPDPTLHGLEVYDSTPETRAEAEALLQEYQLAFGPNFKMWTRRRKAKDTA